MYDLQPDFLDYLCTVNFVVDFLDLGCKLFSFALLITAILGNVTLISIITISTTFYGIFAEDAAKREVLWR